MENNKRPKDGDLMSITDPEGNTITWAHNELLVNYNIGYVKDDKVRIGMFDMNTGKTVWIDDKDEK